MEAKTHIRVVAAVVTDDEGRMLCMQRTRSHELYSSEHWEFPGGKVQEGETDHQALMREIHEEMDWQVYVGPLVAEVQHEYPDKVITLAAYECKGEKREFKLLEHLDYKWLSASQLDELNWAAADEKIVAEIKKNR